MQAQDVDTIPLERWDNVGLRENVNQFIWLELIMLILGGFVCDVKIKLKIQPPHKKCTFTVLVFANN